MKIKKRNEFIEQKPRSKKRKLNYGTQLAHNEQGFAMLGDLKIVRPEPLLIENLKLKLSTKADRYSSAETEAK